GWNSLDPYYFGDSRQLSLALVDPGGGLAQLYAVKAVEQLQHPDDRLDDRQAVVSGRGPDDRFRFGAGLQRFDAGIQRGNFLARLCEIALGGGQVVLEDRVAGPTVLGLGGAGRFLEALHFPTLVGKLGAQSIDLPRLLRILSSYWAFAQL